MRQNDNTNVFIIFTTRYNLMVYQRPASLCVQYNNTEKLNHEVGKSFQMVVSGAQQSYMSKFITAMSVQR